MIHVFDAMPEPAAWSEEYEEELNVRRIIAEGEFIEKVRQAIAEEKKLPQPKWARLARKYLHSLREIFHDGELRLDAQALIEDLVTLSTVPMNDLEKPYRLIGDKYLEVDPYTGEPYPEDVAEEMLPLDLQLEIKRREILETDQEEVSRALLELNAEVKQEAMDRLLFEICQKIINYYDPNPVEVISQQEDYTPLELQAKAWEGPFTSFPWDEEPERYEEGELTSVPLRQEREMMMKGTERLQDLRVEMKPFIDAIKQEARTQTLHWKGELAEFIGYLRTVSRTGEFAQTNNPFAGEWLITAKDRVRASIQRENPKLSEKKARSLATRQIAQMCKDALVGAGPIYIKFDRKWSMDLWWPRMRQAVETSPRVQEFITRLHQVHSQYPPEDLAIVFLSVQPFLASDPVKDDEWMGWESLKSTAGKIGCAGYGSLLDFLEEWGDDILENVMSQGAYNGTWVDHEAELEKLEGELLSTYKDNRTATTAPERTHTVGYMRGVLHALTEEGDLREAGEANWRREVSETGARAFSIVLSETGDHKKAWRAFWNAGRPVRATKDGIVVRSDANGKEQFCNWRLAKWKFENHELHIPNVEKFVALLEEKGWGKWFCSILTKAPA